MHLIHYYITSSRYVMPPCTRLNWLAQGHNVLNLSVCPCVRPSVCYQLKTNKPILLPVGAIDPRSKGVKLSTYECHEVKGQGRRQIWRPGGGILSRPYRSSSFFPHDTMHKRGLCRHAVSSVRPSVRHVHVGLFCQNQYLQTMFSLLGSHTILVFPS